MRSKRIIVVVAGVFTILRNCGDELYPNFKRKFLVQWGFLSIRLSVSWGRNESKREIIVGDVPRGKGTMIDERAVLQSGSQLALKIHDGISTGLTTGDGRDVGVNKNLIYLGSWNGVDGGCFKPLNDSGDVLERLGPCAHSFEVPVFETVNESMGESFNLVFIPERSSDGKGGDEP